MAKRHSNIIGRIQVYEYLEEDPLNVVAVHCKAGKGRTGGLQTTAGASQPAAAFSHDLRLPQLHRLLPVTAPKHVSGHRRRLGLLPSRHASRDYYSIVRTRDNRGVTIPSQRRYVYYFDHLRRQRLNYMPLKTELLAIYVEKPPRVGGAFSKGT